jgi:cysteinyl-tRNA synthetase
VDLRLYNTMGRQVEPFVPLKAGDVGMYCCGPTVYNYAHVGNLRTYVFEDVLRRTLERAGYRVRHVMNVTDVGHLTDDADDGEDKMEKGAREQGRTVWDIADFYTKAFFRDFGLLGCRMPGVVCRATDHVSDMIDLIRRLEAGGYTYEAGGNLCFDIAKFAGYGRLALLDGQDLRAGARIAVDEGKRNPHDFVLWFTRSKFEHQSMLWNSPCIQVRTQGLPVAASVCAISLVWCTDTWSMPPQWMSNCSPRYFRDMALHSMCQPG